MSGHGLGFALMTSRHAFIRASCVPTAPPMTTLRGMRGTGQAVSDRLGCARMLLERARAGAISPAVFGKLLDSKLRRERAGRKEACTAEAVRRRRAVRAELPKKRDRVRLKLRRRVQQLACIATWAPTLGIGTHQQSSRILHRIAAPVDGRHGRGGRNEHALSTAAVRSAHALRTEPDGRVPDGMHLSCSPCMKQQWTPKRQPEPGVTFLHRADLCRAPRTRRDASCRAAGSLHSARAFSTSASGSDSSSLRFDASNASTSTTISCAAARITSASRLASR